MSVIDRVPASVVLEHRAALEVELDLVPNRLFREAFLASGMTASELAWKLGWARHGKMVTADTSRVRRTLGLRDYSPRGGHRTGALTQSRVTYEVAVRLCDALGIDYVEAGV